MICYFCNVIKNRLIFIEATNMAPFRWPDARHDIALAINRVKPMEIIAFSTDTNKVQLKGRGCRERMEHLIDKFKEEDAKTLKRLAVSFFGE